MYKHVVLTHSVAIFFEVKMRELLGEDWDTNASQSKHPPLLRATVCVDLLGACVFVCMKVRVCLCV